MQKSGGIIKTTAAKLNVSRRVLYKWIADSETLQEALLDAREEMIDTTEGMLYNHILEGNLTAIIFYLKTQGKTRGYIEKTELDTSVALKKITGITFDDTD